MSTTSCPRCSAQVTLPVGVRNETTVRCPLCHAHYTLADALVNMPPLLEVVDDADEALPAELFDASPADEVGQPIATAGLDDDETSEADTLELGSLEMDGLEFDSDNGQEAGAETVVDDVSASTIESPVEQPPESTGEADDALLDFAAPEAPAEAEEALDLGDEAELALDFGNSSLAEEKEQVEPTNAETLEFGSEMSDSFDDSPEEEVKFDLEGAEASGGDMTLDFGAPIGEEALDDSSEGDVANLDFGEPVDDQAETVQFESMATEGDEVEFNFDAPEADAAGEEGELREFEDIRVDASGDVDDLPLDMSAVPVAGPVADDGEEEATGKNGKKKEKKKKEKKARVALADGDKPKRSLVGSLVSVALPAVIAIPIALYGALWISKDYDFLGLGNFLPSAMLPAEFSKQPTQLAQYTPPVPAPAATVPQTPSEEPAAEEPTADAATEHVAERPVSDAAEPAPEEMPSEEPADVAPSLTPPTAEAPAEDLAEPEAADPFAPSADAKPAEEMPAEPSDDLFAPSADTPAAAPAEAAADTDPFAPAPAEKPAETPAAADPFGPAPEAKPAAAEDDLFAPDAKAQPAPAEEDPFAPAADEKPAEEMPAGTDPFAPAAGDTPAETPAAADPFAPAPAEKPTEEDPFAPAPAEKPAEKDPFAPAPETPADVPAEPDPFAPAPEDKPADAPTATPAEPDPFAPAPAEMPADKPAADDLFAPEPAKPETTPAQPEATTPAADELFAPAPAEPAAGEPLPEPTAPAETLGPRNVQPASPADVTDAMQTTLAAGQQLMAAEATGDEAQLRKARAAFYVNLFGMAGVITSAQLGEGAAQLDPQLQALAPTLKQQLAADPKRLEALKVFGARWIGFPKRTTNGVVVSGTVESAEQVGKLFYTKTRLGSNPEAPLMTIVTAEQPAVAAGDTVLALGTIVDDPEQQISGYEGSDPTVVWSGMTMKVAPAGN